MPIFQWVKYITDWTTSLTGHVLVLDTLLVLQLLRAVSGSARLYDSRVLVNFLCESIISKTQFIISQFIIIIIIMQLRIDHKYNVEHDCCIIVCMI